MVLESVRVFGAIKCNISARHVYATAQACVELKLERWNVERRSPARKLDLSPRHTHFDGRDQTNVRKYREMDHERVQLVAPLLGILAAHNVTITSHPRVRLSMMGLDTIIDTKHRRLMKLLLAL